MIYIKKFYEAIRYSVKDITIFPGRILFKPMLFAWVITFVAAVAMITDKFHFKNVWGCLVGSLILTILCYSERRES